MCQGKIIWTHPFKMRMESPRGWPRAPDGPSTFSIVRTKNYVEGEVFLSIWFQCRLNLFGSRFHCRLFRYGTWILSWCGVHTRCCSCMTTSSLWTKRYDIFPLVLLLVTIDIIRSIGFGCLSSALHPKVLFIANRYVVTLFLVCVMCDIFP